MKVYKLFRIRKGKLYPLYVNAKEETRVGVWIQAEAGPLAADGKHVKSRLGDLAYRPGWHATTIPYAGHIGKRINGVYHQRPNEVWCECTIEGKELIVTDPKGLPYVPDGWYYYQTNTQATHPWVISGKIRVDRILDHAEVEELCWAAGQEPQPVATSA